MVHLISSPNHYQSYTFFVAILLEIITVSD